MTSQLHDKALRYLRNALNNPNANFRDGQWEAISDLVQNRSRLLVVQRTGWGKSLVYFIATRLLRDQGAGTTLLISPLLALMRNQIAAAQRINVQADTINSSNTQEWNRVQEKLLAGTVDILLISPERLSNEEFRDNILIPIASSIGLFVIDEAHCISDWGHDFRPDYRRIVRILQALPSNIPVLATTATANNRVVNDIKAQLGESLQISRGELTRKSLQLQNLEFPSPAARLAWLAQYIPKLPNSGIVYTLTVRDAQRVAAWLKQQGISAEAYYGDLETEEREILENKLLNNEMKVLVATTALGMGFDKPDLGFVIHYQRPNSVVHYYQQVGRAGRAVEQAYGILLSGAEDEEISQYFINNAFPPEAHTKEVLTTLESSPNGLSVPQLEQSLNLSSGQINKVLKLLFLESPAPVMKQGSKWYATAVNYQPNRQKIEQLTRIRYQEQDQMRDYMNSNGCLMQFLASALDDENPTICGKCAVCLGKDLIPTIYSLNLLNQAVIFLKRSDHIIEPRKKWPLKGAFSVYNFSGNIKPELKAENGRALCLWGDPGWGQLVKQGKYETNHFDDQLVEAMAEMIQRWNPQPKPTWITCIPSLNRPHLVQNFAQKLANGLQIPFIPVVSKIKQNPPQKTMNNSYQQAHNLDGVFSIDREKIMSGSVFLVDDFVDSRWTLTVVSALLRQAGSGQVFPTTLALNSLS
ncbi:RecQ family ATP-dependent DNA helicase [Crocosphaera sp. XPORK-15E]|uniref:RecQ family ATP-dependent DNA helicase n=1 Tax=Crocosphaera sp. XPORK-15E TaxID=3110247 RepID=UPI002B214111|nr:RecQ family ATP-dependent DNA helicase [Crocosphaera sp. XPORK-15E]MEA5533818.1 RecQ family ATP-dependent DNA helicase [Crocosphaera sp. XPORK-15E]